MLPINAAAKVIDFHDFGFGSTLENITYLEVNIPQSYSKLFDLDFTALLKAVKKDLKRWNILPLFLAGRINTIKMNILPKFLYLFQFVPVLIRKTYFKEQDESDK